jgi:hypothetical protein
MLMVPGKLPPENDWYMVGATSIYARSPIMRPPCVAMRASVFNGK